MASAPRGEGWHTAAETSRILGVGRQAIHDALRDGRLESRGQGNDRRIHSRAIVAYAIRTGRDLDVVVKRMEETMTPIDWQQLLGWLLAAVGLYSLLGHLGIKHDEEADDEQE